MIEAVILNYLSTQLNPVPVYMEIPATHPDKFVVIERTGGSISNHLHESTFAVQSYGPSLYEAASLDEQVVEELLAAVSLDEISSSRLNSHYNYTDTSTKRYRYQAVFDISHY